jgi:ABC-type sugar transport system ATPase subunit
MTPVDAQPLLEVRDLHKAYPGVKALDGVDIAVGRGECVAIVGKNGAGKSTLIKALAGAVSPDAGEILVDGEVVHIASPRDAQALGLTFVHQELVGIPDLSVAENIELGLGFPRRAAVLVNWRALRVTAQDALDRLGSEIDPKTQLSQLSIADRRLVMIAHALAQDARLLVLDEPTASLTEREIERLHEIIRGLVASGVTVLYVSHRLDDVFEISERIVVMRDGRVVGSAATAELDRPTLIQMITGPLADDPADRDPDSPVGTGRTLAARGEELLAVDGLSSAVVHDATFTLRRGEVLGIAGLVGAGRTELCRLVFGADKASSGTISVHGEVVRIRSPRAAIAAGIVLVPEDRHTQGTVPDFTVRENITLPSLDRFRRFARLPFLNRGRECAAADGQIKTLAIKTPSSNVVTSKLSGGNQQKVVLGKWLERDADVFILDEPTHGIDVQGKEEIYGLIARLVEQGAGVILVSSEFSELVRVCDRALVMSEGRIHGELFGADLTEHKIVEACFAARETPLVGAAG